MNKYENYLKDLVFLLKEKMESTYSTINENTGADKDFIKGKVFALYEVLDLIKSQANAFQISLEELNLSDVDLEKFL